MFVSNRLPSPLLDGIRNTLGKQPNLFEQLEDYQANEFQYVHILFSSPTFHLRNRAPGRSTLHQAHALEENPNRPGLRFLRVFLPGWYHGSRVVLEFLVTMRTS